MRSWNVGSRCPIIGCCIAASTDGSTFDGPGPVSSRSGGVSGGAGDMVVGGMDLPRFGTGFGTVQPVPARCPKPFALDENLFAFYESLSNALPERKAPGGPRGHARRFGAATGCCELEEP